MIQAAIDADTNASHTSDKPVAPHHKNTRSTARLATASMVGTTLEWYDFTVYNTMAALVFSHLFFPSFDPLSGTILAFSTYAVGYISRPIGGVIFGHLGDKLGRRFVLVATLLLMGLTTGMMGLLPTYSSVGIWSPVWLVALRFVQGVALGGEWAGAVLISVEHGAQDKRGRNASWTQVGPSLGTLLATGFIALVTYFLSSEQFLDWGWRVPFLASLLLVGFGLWLRNGVDETPKFKELEVSHNKAKAPVSDVFRKYWRRLLIAGGVRIGSDVLYALVVVFTLTYVTTVLNLSRTLALTAIMIGTACNAMAVPLFGALSDRIGRRPVYGIGVVLGLIWAFVFFALLDSKQPLLIVAGVVGGLLIHAVMYGPQAAFVTEQFPTKVRYAGSSLAYTLAGIIGGGFAPLIFAALFRSYHSTLVVSLYVIVALALTGSALAAAKETGKSPLEE
jgi:metabolite-proton symporter